MPHVKVLGQFAGAYAKLLWQEKRLPNHASFLRTAYKTLLKREPDPDGLEHYLDALRTKQLSTVGVLRSLLNSDEFKLVYGAERHPLEALHRSRLMLIQQCVPPADVILDLGGAAHDHPEGALLTMGYPHQPRDIFIVDLPPDDRIGGVKRAEEMQEVVTHNGIRVHYLYHSMADFVSFADASFDLVVSGESIEHISESDANIVCREAYRVLRSGGYFCLDTPNAALTRLQSPDAYIHPEHQKEYYVDEIRAKLLHAGFQIVEAKGVCPMPESLKSGRFDYREMSRNMGLSDYAEAGYVFFLKAQKVDQHK